MHFQPSPLFWVGTVLFLIALNAVLSPDARAYTLEGCKWQYPLDVTYADNIYFPIDRKAFTLSVGNWNATAAAVRLRPPLAGQHVDVVAFSTNDSNVSWDGLTYYTCNSGFFSNTISTNIEINHYYTKNYPPLEIESVTGHELGHSLGLGHHQGPYLMDYTTERFINWGIYKPQPDDIRGLIALYGREKVTPHATPKALHLR